MQMIVVRRLTWFLLNSACILHAAIANEWEGRDFPPFYSPESSLMAPKLIQQEIGKDIRLKCGLKENPVNSSLELPVEWYFQSCGGDSHQYSCQEPLPEKWKQLSCAGSPCRPNFYIRNATDEHSGLYKCTMKPYESNDLKTLQIQFVKVYRLEVKAMILPEFLDGPPANRTVKVGSRVVLHCLVQSKAHLATKWFRKINTLAGAIDEQSGIVQYSNETYKLISTAAERTVGDGVYLSKLVLNDVSEDDSGVYACVALNNRGHRMREVIVRVEPSNGELQSRTDPSEFLLLFLMPLGLALIPISLWVCFVFGKKFSRYKKISQNDPIPKTICI